MPNPKYLLELKRRAEKALNSDPPDGLTAFTASWTLWEAVRRRMLILASKREGWTVQQARDALIEERIDNPRFIYLFRVISREEWEESLPMAAGKLWPDIVSSVQLRRRIIHGTSRIGEESLQRSAWNILRFVNLLRDHPLGNPLEKLSGKARPVLSDHSLKDRIAAVE
ncbi:MAG: hypothetical protein P1S46_01295 [bacterium]|nr:hypothetical protein [bacterium]MDT8394956.1 hypothetical protein [bacterium]